MKGIQKFLVALIAITSVHAHAQVLIQPTQGCAIPKLDGDKVPFPLKTANTKFELAENETYLLNGYVVQLEGKPYFKIDFLTQPWLATYHRTQFPHVPVDADDPMMLAMPENELIQMAVVVRREKASSTGHELKDGLRLDLIIPPVRVQQLQTISSGTP